MATEPHPRPPPGRAAALALDGLYLLALIAAGPLLLWRRLVKGKRLGGLGQKLGGIPKRPAGRPRVWVHAVSVGEAIAAQPLIEALKQRRPDLEIVVSTTTPTGQAVAAARYGAEQVFYYPYDLSWVVRRALERVAPTVLVLMELEVWPNLTAEARRRGIPVIVANGRITERAARRYRRFWFAVGPSFRRVQCWLAQSPEYVQRLTELGLSPDTVKLTGNLKYDAIDTAPPDQAALAALRQTLVLDPEAQVLAGGSTHPAEEGVLLEVYAALRRGSFPGLRLVLAPRHPERFGAVENLITAAGFAALRYSVLTGPGRDEALARLDASQRAQAVVLIDAMGVLKRIYALAHVAFVGGSLIPHGGQNIMEPCGLGVSVVHGPHMHNFNDALLILRKCRGTMEVTPQTLQPALVQLLGDPAAARAMGARARAALLRESGAAARSADYICEVLKER